MKRLVFDLTKIPYLKRLISIYSLIVEVLNDQNLFTESSRGAKGQKEQKKSSGSGQ